MGTKRGVSHECIVKVIRILAWLYPCPSATVFSLRGVLIGWCQIRKCFSLKTTILIFCGWFLYLYIGHLLINQIPYSCKINDIEVIIKLIQKSFPFIFRFINFIAKWYLRTEVIFNILFVLMGFRYKSLFTPECTQPDYMDWRIKKNRKGSRWMKQDPNRVLVFVL